MRAIVFADPSTSNVSSLSLPKIKPLSSFYVCYTGNTSNFDDDSIKNDQASVEISLSHYKYMGYFSDTQGMLTPQYVVYSGHNSNSSRGLSISL